MQATASRKASFREENENHQHAVPALRSRGPRGLSVGAGIWLGLTPACSMTLCFPHIGLDRPHDAELTWKGRSGLPKSLKQVK